MTQLKVVDVSSAQGNYNLGTYGEDAIIVKATEGRGYVNPNFEYVAKQAKASNKPLGIYHWLSPNISGASQADYFIEHCGSYLDIANPILDCEQAGITVTQVNDFVNRLKDVKRLTAIIYTSSGSEDFNVSWFNGSSIPSKCGLWIAGYPYLEGTRREIPDWTKQEMLYSIAPWSSIVGWQFSSDPIDRSWFYVDTANWLSLTRGGYTNKVTSYNSSNLGIILKGEKEMKIITITTDGDYYGVKYKAGACFFFTGDSLRYIERPQSLGVFDLLQIPRYSLDAIALLLIIQDLNLKIS